MNTETTDTEGKFLALVSENRLKILKVCHVYGWSQEDREDIYQEILFQIWRSLPSLKEAGHSNTWLFRIALNTSISFARRQKLRRERTVTCDHEQIQDLMDANAIPDQETNPQLAALYRAISKLNVMEKAVITLFLEDLSYEQIAEVTGLTSSNVGVTLHRAKKKLSELMEESSHE